MKTLILLASILITMSGAKCTTAHAMATRAEITRRDLNHTLHPEGTHQRVERIASTMACYQLIIDGRSLPRCACVDGTNERATLSEVACLYAQVMGIPVFPITATTEDSPMVTKKPTLDQ